MIAGVGTDIIGLERIGKLLQGRRGEVFIRRILTEAELELAAAKSGHPRRFTEFVAGRWAAKEAVSKSLGTGIGAVVGFQDLEILPDRQGKPVCTLSDGLVERLGEPLRVHVSISHADGWASAFAVAERA